MSGIAGVIYFEGAPVPHGLIDKVTMAMKRRGPDAQTSWQKGSVALGHCLLRTTPESLEESQPLVSADGKHVLVWDGRLDNRDELRRSLRSAGVTLRDNTDPEMVLSAYVVWGEACPKRLLGDFAFAVWDSTKQILYCARDPLGARPLYITNNKHLFALSSEDESLLAVPGVSNKPNDDRVASVLVMPFYRCCDLLQSWLDDVRRLAPGHSITIKRDGKIRVKRHYEISVQENLKFRNDEECREAFLEVFSESVRCRLRAQSAPAVMMSGGLDSTAIAATAKCLQPDNHREKIMTFSAVSDDVQSCIESRSIHEVIDRLDLDGQLVSVPSINGICEINDLNSVFTDRPHPVNHSIPLPDLLCFAAANQGQRVLMHGVSGDEVTHVPNDYLAWYFEKGNWAMGYQECKAASQNSNFLSGRSTLKLILESGWSHFSSRRAKRLVHDTFRRKRASRMEGTVIGSSFAKQIELESRLDDWQYSVSDGYKKSIQEEYLSFVFPTGLMAGLEGYDRMAGRHGVDLRDPWADVRVLDFFARLPLQYKIHDGWTKYPVRIAMRQALGEQVVSRKDKQHVGWYLIDQIVKHRREAIYERLKNVSGSLGRYVESDALGTVLKNLDDSGTFGDALTCYFTVSLAMWLDRIEAK